MARYWLCVCDEANWKIVRKTRLWGVSDRNRALIQKTKINDVLVFYVKPKQIAGTFRVVSEPFTSGENIFHSKESFRKETFPNRVRLRLMSVPKERAHFVELVSRLSFVKNKAEWRAYIRRAMQLIPEQDYHVILSSITNARSHDA